MDTYENCSVVQLEDGALLLEDVMTPHGPVEQIYLGAGGVYVVLFDAQQPLTIYDYLRNLLGATKVRLYVLKKGEYVPSSDSFATKINPIDNDALSDVVREYLYMSPQQYTQATLERMKTTLVHSDARARGYYIDDDGFVYLCRHHEFCRASETDPEIVFNLCVYGGVFGLHRFALGKWVTGLFYLFTCGLFLCGWLFDLVQLFLGALKDKRKNYLLPLKNRKHKLRFLPVGACIGAVIFVCWLHLFHVASPAPSMI